MKRLIGALAFCFLGYISSTEAIPPMTASELLENSYVISLKRHPERLETTLNRMLNAGFSRVQHFEGIDGFEAHNDPLWKILKINAIEPGKRGCAASHLLLWKQYAQDPKAPPCIFVAEDDLLPHSQFANIFPLYWERTPQHFDIIFVGNQMERPKKNHLVVHQPTFCTHAYIVSKKGAKKLLNLYLKKKASVSGVIDIFLIKMQQKNAIRYYCYNGAVFPEEDEDIRQRARPERASGICFQDLFLGTTIHSVETLFE